MHDRRGIAARLRALRAPRAGIALRLRRLAARQSNVYHRSEPIIAEIDAAGYDAQAIGNREFHYLFPAACGARRAHAPSAASARIWSIRKGRDAAFRALRFDAARYGRRRACTSAGLAGHAVSGGQPVGARFRLAFSGSVGCGCEPYARAFPTATRWSCSRTSACRSTASSRGAYPRIDLLLGGHSHDTLFAAGVRRRRADRARRSVRTFVSRSELEYRRRAGRFALGRFRAASAAGRAER